jgi:hypothetical protein
VVAQLVLPPLLPEDDLTGFLPRREQTAVFHPAVELPDRAVLLPAEVTARHDAAVAAADPYLQVRCGEPEPVDEHPAAALAHALAQGVGEVDGSSGGTDPGDSSHVRDAAHQVLPGGAARPQCAVGDHDGGLEGHRAGDVHHGPGDAGGGQAVDHGEVLVRHPADVLVQAPAAGAGRRRATSDVDSVEGHAPQGQAVQDRGREVAHHRR